MTLFGLGALAGAASKSAAATSPTVVTGVTTATQDWQTVDLAGAFASPVALVLPAYADARPTSPRLRDVSGDGFDHRLEGWKYLDDYRHSEDASYVVVDSGAEVLGAATAEAGTASVVHDEWTAVEFDVQFPTAPVVFTQLQTANGSDQAVTRNANLTVDGFAVAMQEEEDASAWHSREEIGYVAVERGTGDSRRRRLRGGGGSRIGRLDRDLVRPDVRRPRLRRGYPDHQRQ